MYSVTVYLCITRSFKNMKYFLITISLFTLIWYCFRISVYLPFVWIIWFVNYIFFKMCSHEIVTVTLLIISVCNELFNFGVFYCCLLIAPRSISSLIWKISFWYTIPFNGQLPSTRHREQVKVLGQDLVVCLDLD